MATSRKVEIRKLQLNLTEICKTCEHHPDIISFLLRRGDAELVELLVLKLVRVYIMEHQASFSSVVQLLKMTQTMNGSERRNSDGGRKKAVGEMEFVLNNNIDTGLLGRTKMRSQARNAKGFLQIQQTEFCSHVWRIMLQDANVVKECNLSVYLVEYIKNLRDNEVPVGSNTCVALAECFMTTEKPNKLYQFLHYHVLADSVELAEFMVREGKSYSALMQVGLDMYFRLQEFNLLVRTLLDIGQTERAMEIARNNMGLDTCDVSILPGVAFFDSLVRSVTSSEQIRSPLQVTQMLGSLLHFLRVWDPAALQCSSPTSLSALASSATFPFPDTFVLFSSRANLRMAFGFTALQY